MRRQVRLADHEVDGQENLLRDGKRRALASLEDVVHCCAVADDSQPGSPVGACGVFTVDGRDGVIIGHIDAFYAVGRGEGASSGHAGKQARPASWLCCYGQAQIGSDTGCGLLYPLFLIVKNSVREQHSQSQLGTDLHQIIIDRWSVVNCICCTSDGINHPIRPFRPIRLALIGLTSVLASASNGTSTCRPIRTVRWDGRYRLCGHWLGRAVADSGPSYQGGCGRNLRLALMIVNSSSRVSESRGPAV